MNKNQCSPIHNNREKETESGMVETEKKIYWGMAARECDSCRSSPSLLFCRPHAAFLCGPCDSLLHVTDSSPHERVWMCEVCEQAPAAFTCKADAATLCVNCDSDIHSANPLSQRHDRSATVPFFQPLSSIVGPNCKLHRSKGTTITDFLIKPNEDYLEEEEGEKKVVVGDQYFFLSADPLLDLEYGSSSMELAGKSGNRSDSVVPVQKPINYHQRQHDVVPFFAGGSYQSHSYSPPMVQSVSSSDVGVVPEASVEITNSYGYSYGGPLAGVAQLDLTESLAMAAVPLTGNERVARVMRYREKKKNRKFEKTIRYASRKAYAETRPRIKGRFAKRTPELDDSVDSIYASSAAAVAALMMETGYVVVPSY